MASRQQQQQITTATLQSTQHPRNSRVFVFVLIGLSLFFFLRYTSRLIEYGQEQISIERWEQKVAQAKLDQTELTVYRDYVLSDAYVESVSRRELLMARPGDTLVVVLPEGAERGVVDSESLSNGVDVGDSINGEEAASQPSVVENSAEIEAPSTQVTSVQTFSQPTPTSEESEPIWRQWLQLFYPASEQ